MQVETLHSCLQQATRGDVDDDDGGDEDADDEDEEAAGANQAVN